MVTRIDYATVTIAAGGGLAVILPGAALSALVAARSDGASVWLSLAVIVAGFTVAGLVAGRRRNDTPILHGALGAGAAFVIALTVGLTIAAFRDRSISVVAIPIGALAAITAGVGGSLVADLTRRRSMRRNHAGG